MRSAQRSEHHRQEAIDAMQHSIASPVSLSRDHQSLQEMQAAAVRFYEQSLPLLDGRYPGKSAQHIIGHMMSDFGREGSLQASGQLLGSYMYTNKDLKVGMPPKEAFPKGVIAFLNMSATTVRHCHHFTLMPSTSLYVFVCVPGLCGVPKFNDLLPACCCIPGGVGSSSTIPGTVPAHTLTAGHEQGVPVVWGQLQPARHLRAEWGCTSPSTHSHTS